MSKALVMMRDVICKFHPRFVESEDLRRFGLDYPTLFNIERLIEESLAAAGNMEFVDAAGYDFLPDWSDSKTVTINANTRQAYVCDVENKIGALRISAYNPHKDCVDFFFVPKLRVASIKRPCYGKDKHKERILISYNKKNHYSVFEEFRVRDFSELALIRD
jgi:hypothetical protein